MELLTFSCLSTAIQKFPLHHGENNPAQTAESGRAGAPRETYTSTASAKPPSSPHALLSRKSIITPDAKAGNAVTTLSHHVFILNVPATAAWSINLF